MKKILFFIALIFAQATFAQIPKPQKDTYVNDFAGVLTKTQITELNKSIFEIEKAHQVQLAIVLVDKVPAAYDIQDFAVLIGKKWRVGKNKKGIVYVAAISQHKQRIEVARNLDNVFTSAKCQSVMDYMKESFRGKDYHGGLVILVDQISSALQGSAPSAPQTASAPAAATTANTVKNTAKADDDGNFWVGLIFVAVVIIAIVLYVRRQNRKRRQIDNFYKGNPNFYNPNQAGQGGQYNPNNPNPGYGGPGYGGPGYGQPDHTVRNVVTGAVLGAAAGYAARTIQDNINNNHQHNNQDQGYNSNNSGSVSNDDSGNQPSNWGNWGGGDSSSGDSSYDSGFSDDSSSSDSDSSDSSGATSDW